MSLTSKTCIRVGMFLLFIVALATTVSTITGIKVIDMQAWNNKDGQSTHIKEDIEQHMKPTTLPQEKKEGVLLEKAVDWSQYPTVDVLATGYTAGVESTGKTSDHPGYGITYSGVKVKRDLYSTIAADLKVFPIGTVLFIPGYGYGVVADKGGAIKGNRLDLYYETVADVYEQWGKKSLKVFVVKKGTGRITEEELRQLNEAETMQVFRQQYAKKLSKN